MPTPPGTKFRVVHRGGRMIRLAILNGKVIEAKDIGPSKKKKRKKKK